MNNELPQNVIDEANALGIDPETYAEMVVHMIDMRLADLVAAYLEHRTDDVINALQAEPADGLRVLLGSAIEKLGMEFEAAVERGEVVRPENN